MYIARPQPGRSPLAVLLQLLTALPMQTTRSPQYCAMAAAAEASGNASSLSATAAFLKSTLS
eukprot:13116791-Alexandrium_andersonii.AAC.1